jgi:hypothetical protein
MCCRRIGYRKSATASGRPPALRWLGTPLRQRRGEDQVFRQDQAAQFWRAPLHYPALSKRPTSTTTALTSSDRHLLQLAFEVHGSFESAHGTIRQQGCEGTPVMPAERQRQKGKARCGGQRPGPLHQGANRTGPAQPVWSCWHTLGKKSKNCEMSAWQPNQPPAG